MERQATDMVPLGRDGFFKDPFFSSTWEEFDQDRNQIMKKSGNGFWDKVESDMADFEASVAAMEADMNQRMAPFKPGVPSWALPQNQHKNWSITNEMDNSFPSTSSSMMCKDDININKDKWEISIDVSNFSPDNLKVKVTGDVVVVSGSQESNNSSDDNSSRTSQSFSRSYTLPSGCDPDSVSSTLNNSGQLLVSCPRPYFLQGPSAKAIKM